MNVSPIIRGRAGTWITVGIAAGVLVGLVAGPVMAGALAPARQFAVTPNAQDQPPEHTISVTGSGKTTIAPDQATIRLGVLVERPSAKDARNAAAEAMTKVVAAIRKLGIADKDIQTALVSLSPAYDYPNNAKPSLRGYQMQNSVSVLVRDLAKVADVLDDAVAAGATTVDGVGFDVADRTAAESNARQAALKDARAKAEALASGLGVRVGTVASVSENATQPIPYTREMAVPAAGGAADASTPIQPGTMDVVISVSVSFLVG